MRNRKIQFKAVIFDSDGTLVNSTYIDYLAWKRIFQEHGKQISYKDYVPLLGIKSLEVIQHILHLKGQEVQDTLDKRFYYVQDEINKNGISAVDGVQQLLDEIKNRGLKIALATSSRREKVEMILYRLQLTEYFDVIVTGEEAANGKPAPDIYQLAANKLEIEANDCLVFEDAINGVKAAKNAGMTCVAITTTNKSEELREADLVIESYSEASFEELCRRLPNS